MTDTPVWHPVATKSSTYEKEVLASEEQRAAGVCIAMVESFGYGWFANAMPPQSEGTSSMVPGMVRGGNFDERVEAAKAWCERICGLHPEKAGDRRSEPVVSDDAPDATF